MVLPQVRPHLAQGAVSYRDCLACKDAGTTPKKGANVHVVYDPAIQIHGCPTIMGHGISAQMMAVRVLKFGLKSEMENYDLTREELLVACWWAGLFGPRRLKQALGEWAEVAGAHLWHRCVAIPDPPQAPVSTARD